jgi:dTDP-4-dehydrorhamnose reductase
LKQVAIFGAFGQIGTDLSMQFEYNNWRVNKVSHNQVSIENYLQVKNYLEENPTDLIINAAAFHKVEKCEVEIAKSWMINTQGASNLAIIAEAIKARYVFLSSDYVFDGFKGSPYKEKDLVSPINVYGVTKAAAENTILSISTSSLVARVSSVFGSFGKSSKGMNFVDKIITIARKNEPIIITDEFIMSPSYSLDIAKKIFELVNLNGSGIFHLCNEGSTNWFEFAIEICSQLGISIEIKSGKEQNSSAVRRPLNSSLCTCKAKTLNLSQRNWQEALNAYLMKKGHLN